MPVYAGGRTCRPPPSSVVCWRRCRAHRYRVSRFVAPFPQDQETEEGKGRVLTRCNPKQHLNTMCALHSGVSRTIGLEVWFVSWWHLYPPPGGYCNIEYVFWSREDMYVFWRLYLPSRRRGSGGGEVGENGATRRASTGTPHQRAW